MENESRAFSEKLVKEYEVPMVSIDGEAHPEITLAAVGLGIMVACIILITLIAFISRRKRQLFSGSPKMKYYGPEVPTISKKIDTSSCRSSTVTIYSDLVTRI